MAKKELVLQVDKDVKGKDFQNNTQFVYDQLFVEINGFKIKVKAKDGTSREMIHQALHEGQKLVLNFEDINGKDEEGKEFTYSQLFVICDEDQLLLKANDRTGQKKIVKYIQSNASPSL